MSLLDKYEAFKDFLNSKGIRYKEETLERGDKFFRIPQRLSNEKIIEILVIFSEQNIKILILGIAKIESEEKKIACYKLFNECALQYSFFKFYIRENGDVNAEGDATLSVVKGEFQPRVLMEFAATGLDLVQDVYEEINKIQQA